MSKQFASEQEGQECSRGLSFRVDSGEARKQKSDTEEGRVTGRVTSFFGGCFAGVDSVEGKETKERVRSGITRRR